MFAVITKLLFIANNTDNNNNNNNNNNNDSFVSLFKQTNLFKSFKLYYNRINPSDISSLCLSFMYLSSICFTIIMQCYDMCVSRSVPCCGKAGFGSGIA